MLMCYQNYILRLNLIFIRFCISLNILTCVHNNRLRIRVFCHLKISLHIFQLAIEVFLNYFTNTFASKLTIVIEMSCINIGFRLCSPFQCSAIFSTIFINSVKTITVWSFFNSFSIKNIIFESTIILKLFRMKMTFLGLCSIFFHATFIIRSIIQNVKAGPLSKPIYKLSHKQRTIFFIHFSKSVRSSGLSKKQKILNQIIPHIYPFQKFSFQTQVKFFRADFQKVLYSDIDTFLMPNFLYFLIQFWQRWLRLYGMSRDIFAWLFFRKLFNMMVIMLFQVRRNQLLIFVLIISILLTADFVAHYLKLKNKVQVYSEQIIVNSLQ